MSSLSDHVSMGCQVEALIRRGARVTVLETPSGSGVFSYQNRWMPEETILFLRHGADPLGRKHGLNRWGRVIRRCPCFLADLLANRFCRRAYTPLSG
jgi:hypothetical protein